MVPDCWCLLADRCPYCGKRRGLIFGIRGFGLWQRWYADWCHSCKGRPLGGAESSFAVTVTKLSGEAKTLVNLSPSCCFLDFRCRVAEEFRMPPAVVQLMLGTRLFTTVENPRPLYSLGLVEGSQVTLVRQRFMDIAAGKRLEVCFAGSRAVRGTYLCCRNEGGHGPGYLAFRQQNALFPHWIAWWPAKEGNWPAAWYMENSRYFALYFHPSENCDELPPDMWEVYTAVYSSPGALPAPTIQQV